MHRAGRWQELMGPSWGQYGTHVDGCGQGGIFIHSVAGSTKSVYNLPSWEYLKLGNPASHGCIRTCVAEDIRQGKEETIGELVTTLQKLMR